MQLIKYVDVYASEHLITDSTIDRYRWTVRSLDRSTGRRVKTAELRPPLVNAWLRDEYQRLSPHTCKSRRADICALWRFAASRNQAPPFIPPLVIRTSRKKIAAVPPDVISGLVRHANALPGPLRGTSIPQGLYWSTFLATAYETALRTSDLLQLRPNDSGRWTLLQRKTGRHVAVSVSPDTLRRLVTLAEASPTLFDLSRCRWWYAHALARVTSRLGRRITPQMLRQSAASEIERRKPHTAWVALGHSGPATTQTWYIDDGHAYSDVPRPHVDWR